MPPAALHKVLGGGWQCQGGGQQAKLVLPLRAHPGPMARGKVLGVMLQLCPTHSAASSGGDPGPEARWKSQGAQSREGEALRHRGRGPWSPATSGVSSGLWVPFVDIQSLRKA